MQDSDCATALTIVCDVKCRIEITCKRGKCKVNAVKGYDRDVVAKLLECNRFPLPPYMRSGLVIGVSEEGVEYAVERDIVWRHILIIGGTGSGKTTTAALLLRELYFEDIPAVVFDWAGEYEQKLLKLGIDFTVFSDDKLPTVALLPEGVPVEAVVDSLKRVLSLSEQQSTILLHALSFTDTLNIRHVQYLAKVSREGFKRIEEALEHLQQQNDLASLVELLKALWTSIEEVDSLLAFSRAEREIWAALLRRIGSIAFSKYAELFSVKGGSIEAILTEAARGRHVVLNVSSIENRRIRALYVSLAIANLFELRVRGIGKPVVAVVEEAHNVVEASRELILHLLAEARKYGLGLILITSLPKLLGDEAFTNSGLVIIHKGADLKTSRLDMLKAEASSLRLGEVLVLAAGESRPVKLYIPW